MTRILPLTAALLLSATAVIAEETGPGGHFVTNWDLDGNGAVSLAEATERRGDIFTTFDANNDGFLSDEEYTAFDEARSADQAEMREEMAAEGMGGQGKGHGKGQGKGNGKGHGKGGMGGAGMGHGNPEENGMMRAFNDVDGDGQVSRDEFLSGVPDWFAKMDRDGSGEVTTADFGPGN